MAGSSSRGAQFASAIDDLLRQCPELEAVAVVTFDGAPLVTALPEHIEERRIAATMATLFEFAEHAANLLSRGSVTAVHVAGETGSVYALPASDTALLITLVERGVAAEAVDFDVRRSAGRIAEILAGRVADGGDPELDGETNSALPHHEVHASAFNDEHERLLLDDDADPVPEDDRLDLTVTDDDAWPYSGSDLGLVTDDRHDGGPA